MRRHARIGKRVKLWVVVASVMLLTFLVLSLAARKPKASADQAATTPSGQPSLSVEKRSSAAPSHQAFYIYNTLTRIYHKPSCQIWQVASWFIGGVWYEVVNEPPSDAVPCVRCLSPNL